MRAKGAMARFLAILALVLALVPTGALARNCPTALESPLPCCTMEASADAVCHGMDAMDSDPSQVQTCPHGAPADASETDSASDCGCAVAPATPDSDLLPVLAQPSPGFGGPQVDVALPSLSWTPALPQPPPEPKVSWAPEPRHLRAGPHCVWLGRAPPVQLA